MKKLAHGVLYCVLTFLFFRRNNLFSINETPDISGVFCVILLFVCSPSGVRGKGVDNADALFGGLGMVHKEKYKILVYESFDRVFET